MSTPNISQRSVGTAFRPYIHPKESKIKTEIVNFLATAAIASIAACFCPALGILCLSLYTISMVTRNKKELKELVQSVKDFVQFSLFKRSTPDDEIQEILKGIFNDSLNDHLRDQWDKPIFIKGKKFHFLQMNGNKHEIILRDGKKNQVSFTYDNISKKYIKK